MAHALYSGPDIIAIFANPQEYPTTELDDNDPAVLAFKSSLEVPLSTQDYINSDLGRGLAETTSQVQLVNGNSVSDPYANNTYIDVGSSVNLDDSTSSERKPTRQAPTSLVITAGQLTAGNMTMGGGLAALVDGNTAQGYTACARNATAQGWFVVSFPAPVAPFDFTLFPSNNRGFQDSAGGSPTISVTVSAKNGATPIGPADDSVTPLGGTGNFTDATTPRAINSTNTFSKWEHFMIVINSTAAGVCAAEIQIREAGLYNAMTLQSTAFVNLVPPEKIATVHEVAYDADDAVVFDDAVAAENDFYVEKSRDGTNWVFAPLSEVYSFANPRKIVLTTGKTDVSEQPAVSNAYYRIKTKQRERPIKFLSTNITWGN